MCGIIGYVGKKSASPILLEGLRRLEYRGYDSAGVALLHAGSLLVRKKKGKIDEGLARLLKSEPVAGQLGIGHTRWATHGVPSDKNCHPHLDQSGQIAVVHNGVIENYDTIKQKLHKSGHTFKSDTDTEVLAHLIGDKLIDLECGWNAGVKKCILVRTGYGAEVERDDAGQIKRAVVVDGLAEMAEWVLSNELKTQNSKLKI